MAKTKRQCKPYFEEVYNAPIFYMIGGTVEELREFFINIHGKTPELEESLSGVTWSSLDYDTLRDNHYLWLDAFDYSNIYDDSKLLHEIDHLANNILQGVGIKFSGDSEEAFSYYKEHLYEKFLGAFDYKKRKKRMVR